MFSRCYVSFARVIAEFDNARDSPIFSHRSYLCSWILWKVSRKVNEGGRSKIESLTDRIRDFEIRAYLTSKNIRWDQNVHATFQVNNHVALQACKMWIFIDRAVDAQIQRVTSSKKIPQLFATVDTDVISSRLKFAFDSQQQLPGHIDVWLKNRIGNKNDSRRRCVWTS